MQRSVSLFFYMKRHDFHTQILTSTIKQGGNKHCEAENIRFIRERISFNEWNIIVR